MRVEKFSLPSFDGTAMAMAAVMEGAMKRPYVPPSLIDDKPKEKKPEAPPPPPTFSEEELKNAEQESYRKGFLEGTKEGHMQAQSEQAEVDRNLTQAVEQVATRLHDLITQYNAFIAEQQKELPLLALSIARKVAGDALDGNPMPLIQATVTACVERLLGEPHISVTVNNALSDALENRLITHFANNTDPGEISIHGDPALAPGDCRIDWERGKAERNTEELWQQVETLVRTMSAADQPPHAAAAPQETTQEPTAPQEPAPPPAGPETPQS